MYFHLRCVNLPSVTNTDKTASKEWYECRRMLWAIYDFWIPIIWQKHLCWEDINTRGSSYKYTPDEYKSRDF